MWVNWSPLQLQPLSPSRNQVQKCAACRTLLRVKALPALYLSSACKANGWGNGLPGIEWNETDKEVPLPKFVIAPHMRLQEWVAEEKGYFAAESLDYEFRDELVSQDGKRHDL